MALIVRPQKYLKKQIRVSIDAEVFEQIKQYCEWQDIRVDYFIEKAADSILTRDKDFKEHLRLQLPQHNCEFVEQV